ncbi:MAG: hypothetical protein HRU14_13920 [Planctomycetes bacterium]|jgi:ABC-type glycerol-3-phosphate transport system substrate-binding protein|nr:hypothetical protein [Planctomycetota bacterium]
MRIITTALVAVALLGLGACGGDEPTDSPETVNPPAAGDKETGGSDTTSAPAAATEEWETITVLVEGMT